jgi:hypothetical protein
MQSLKLRRIDVASLAPAAILVTALLPLLIGCGRSNSGPGSGIPRPYTPAPIIVKSDPPTPKPPPIDPQVVRADVERQESWSVLRKAGCPRKVLDRWEERRRWPAIDALDGLQYATISDYTSAGLYEKLITLTSTGRIELREYLDERPDKYIITIARRQYKPGTEQFNKPYGRDDRLSVQFLWVWTPLNALGRRLSLWSSRYDRDEHFGTAFYVQTPDGWKLDNLSLESDRRDYEHAVSN